MNYAQFLLFIVYIGSVLSSGIGIYSFLNKENLPISSRALWLGEVFLLGSISLIGQLLMLSLLGLYRAGFLWSVVLLNYAFLLKKGNLSRLNIYIRKPRLDIPLMAFFILLLILIFRNCFFMIDTDDISIYLFVQKLWLSAGSSLIGGPGFDIRIFVPHFDALPYGLGLSIFGQETLFAELVNLSWRLIAVLLVFGYTSYRFNRYYGLAASFLVLFDQHIFYSGVNPWVTINAALISFLFACAYNFYEARTQASTFRLMLALIFLSQLMANKYQMAYVLFMLLLLGLFIQKSPSKALKDIMINKKQLAAVLAAFFILSLWYIKNLIVTKDPFFPIFAGNFAALGWTSDKQAIFMKVVGGIGVSQFLKYMNYLFVWPGVIPAKYLMIIISFLPLLIVAVVLRSKIEKEQILELVYWLGLSILVIMGICLTCHQDPRYYRYPIAIMSFSVIFSIDYFFRNCLNLKKKIILTAVIILISLPGFGVLREVGGSFPRPTIRENVDTLLNRIHLDYAIKKYYPSVQIILEGIASNREKFEASAWDAGSGNNFPLFLLPHRPMVGLWLTNIIKWGSYNDPELIVSDLSKAGIKWLMRVKDGKLIFVSIQDYALEAVKLDRKPAKFFYDYGFPKELSYIRYRN